MEANRAALCRGLRARCSGPRVALSLLHPPPYPLVRSNLTAIGLEWSLIALADAIALEESLIMSGSFAQQLNERKCRPAPAPRSLEPQGCSSLGCCLRRRNRKHPGLVAEP